MRYIYISVRERMNAQRHHAVKSKRASESERPKRELTRPPSSACSGCKRESCTRRSRLNKVVTVSRCVLIEEALSPIHTSIF